MALGTYGITRPADMSPEDVEIIMNYTPSRDVTQNFVLKKLDAASLLTPYFNNNETGGNVNEILGGLYNLQLPAAEFNALGIYTLYIRPAEIRTNITDCGILSALPNVKGIIIDLNNVDPQYRNKFVNQGLVGFRIEYLNSDASGLPLNSYTISFTIYGPVKYKSITSPDPLIEVTGCSKFESGATASASPDNCLLINTSTLPPR